MELEQAKLRKRWDGWWILYKGLHIGPFDSYAKAHAELQRGIENGDWRKEQIGDR